MNIEYLHNGYVRITPREGMVLISLSSMQEVSEAVVKENKISKFKTFPAS